MIAALGADAEPPDSEYLAVGLRAATGWRGPCRTVDKMCSPRRGAVTRPRPEAECARSAREGAVPATPLCPT
jgi:hypothetical protein